MNIPKGYEECMNCDPCLPECDEGGLPYACYQCGNSGYVLAAPGINIPKELSQIEIKTGDNMDIKLAIKIINDKREIYGMSLLDMAIVLKAKLDKGELDNREAAAIRVFLREGRALFAPSTS